MVDAFISVVEEQHRIRAGEMAIGIEVLQRCQPRTAGVHQEPHIAAAAAELGEQLRLQADVEPFQPIKDLRQRAGP